MKVKTPNVNKFKQDLKAIIVTNLLQIKKKIIFKIDFFYIDVHVMREKLSQKYSLYFTTGSSAFQRFDKLGLKNIKLFLLANVQSNAKNGHLLPFTAFTPPL